MPQDTDWNVSQTVGVQLKIRLAPLPGLTSRKTLNGKLYIPVVLGDSFDITEDFRHEDYITPKGEFSAPLGAGQSSMLRSFGIDTMTCTWNPRWMTHPNQDPEEVKNNLAKIGRSREPVELLAKLTRHYAGYSDFHGAVTLRTMTRSLRRGEPDSRYFTLDFREFNELVGDRLGHGQGGGGGGGGGTQISIGEAHWQLPTKHKLKGDDSLRSLARLYYQDENRYHRIGDANGLGQWGGNDHIVLTNRYHIGDDIVIPKEFG